MEDLLEQAQAVEQEQEQEQEPKESAIEEVARVVGQHNPEQGFEEGLSGVIEQEVQVADFECHQPGVEADADIDVH